MDTIENKSITELQQVKRAWEEADVPQCGFCQPGQIMTATGLLSAGERFENEDEVSGRISNICRCGTYGRIQKATLRAQQKIDEGHETARDAAAEVTQ